MNDEVFLIILNNIGLNYVYKLVFGFRGIYQLFIGVQVMLSQFYVDGLELVIND